VICPSCGENNSANFRYCGMCGTALDAPRRPVGAPRTAGTDAQRAFTLQNDAVVEDAARARTTARASAGAVHEPPPSAGPSILGLNQPFPETNESRSVSGTSTGEPFSGLDSFFEPDDPGVSARGIIFLLLLLVGLGAGGWWAYAHYNGPKSGTAAQTTTQLPAEQANAPEPAANNPAPSAKTPEASASTNPNSSPSSASNTTPSQPAAASPAESANSAPPPGAEAKSDQNPSTTPKPAERSPASERPSSSERAARNQKIARAAIKPAPRPSSAAPASGDKGDAAFKRGEAYLYGRGLPENCDQAIKNLKEASAKQNAKARSTFGTMYATGHCVPRNLPTSYSWFALALHADPNNQILEKDLTAVWNQMTPPERQVAAKTKP
jgi:hypothetical protein